MNKKQRSKIIIDVLEELYPDPQIPLDHVNDFSLLIAVVLSAQSTDKKVNEITPKLFDLASNASSMYELGEDHIYNLINQLGLARQKAKHIYLLSKILIEKHNCRVPNNFRELEELPGVGHKTASVVMAQAFNVPTFPVDTHIHRLAQRWGLSNGESVLRTERELKSIFPQNKWNKLHIQMIYYGREYCSARGCDGTFCRLCRLLFPNRQEPVICMKA